MSAKFRTFCHSLGLSALTLSELCEVQPRTAQYWMSKGDPPEDVWHMVQSLDDVMGQQVSAALTQADITNMALPTGQRAEITLTAYRTKEAWYAAHPEFEGLPILTHSIMLRRVWETLQGMGYEVSIVWKE